MTQEAIGAAAREYKPLLDDMRRAMEQYLGDQVLWLPRQDTAVTDRSRTDERQVIRVGPDFGRGVLLAMVDPVRLTEIVNAVLARHDFPPQEPMTGSESGHLHCSSRDGSMAEVQFWLKGDVEYWVDVPVR
jgi:hypothetical protein